MDFIRQPGRIWLSDAGGRTIAEVLFPDEDGKTVNITHTFVDDSLRGQGVAGALMEAVAGQLRCEGKTAKLTCSYAAQWFQKHPEYGDVVKKEN